MPQLRLAAKGLDAWPDASTSGAIPVTLGEIFGFRHLVEVVTSLSAPVNVLVAVSVEVELINVVTTTGHLSKYSSNMSSVAPSSPFLRGLRSLC